MELLEIVGIPPHRMARDPQGRLYLQQDSGWEEFPFHELYRSDYPACEFSALGYYDQQFYIAGVDDAGNTHLFSSSGGSVWTEHPLIAADPMGHGTVLRGRVVKMLCRDKPFQLILLTDEGRLALVPDCPKCVRIERLSQKPQDAYLQEDWLWIQWESGQWEKLPLCVLQQVRVTWEYARSLCRKTRVRLVDLGGDNGPVQPLDAPYIHMDIAHVDSWLETVPKRECLIFLCRYGVQADQCAKLARRRGFSDAYSLGGMDLR